MKITRENVSYSEDTVPTTIDGFKTWEFTSGGTTGEDFKVFAETYKNEIKKRLPKGVIFANYSTGHYFVSGFLEKNGKYVYFSVSDVRHFPGEWFNNILIRTAQHISDYTGGSNGLTTLDDFSDSVGRLFLQMEIK